MNNYFVASPVFTQKNAHLIVSIVLVLPIALGYGLFPKMVLPIFLEIEIEGTDLTNIFRAIMGFYLGMVFLWIKGVTTEKYWLAASWSLAVFMLGLGFGRILSLFIDGLPSTLFSLGMVGELVLGFWAVIMIKKYVK